MADVVAGRLKPARATGLHCCLLADADCWLMRAGAPLLQLLVLKSDIRVRVFSVDDDLSHEKLRDMLLQMRSSAMTHFVLMTSHHLAKLVLDQVIVLTKYLNTFYLICHII